MTEVAVDAFGLHVRLPEGLLFEDARPITEDDGRIATVVTVEPELAWEWAPQTAQRVRETHEHGRVVWSVDVHDEHGYLMQAQGLATILVSHDGLSVRCSPETTGETAWSALIGAQALPLASTLRGLEVLHASAVTLDGRAHLFCAGPGVGKSSLAAQLVLRGAGILSDDALAVDDELVAHPSPGGIHFRDAELVRLSESERTRLRVGPSARLDGRAVGRVEPASPAPLAAIYMLERASGGPAIVPTESVDPRILLGSTFNISVRSPERLVRHLDICARIAERIPMFRIQITPKRNAAMLAAEILACQ